MATKVSEITMYGFNNYSIAYLEAIGLSKCFKAYAENCASETIMDGGIGFNSSSGYVYIGLENGVQICSCLGRDVEYLITDFNDGSETFYDAYEEALKHNNKEQEPLSVQLKKFIHNLK